MNQPPNKIVESENLIRQFISSNGAFLICTTDDSFSSLFSSVIYSIMKSRDHIFCVQDFAKVLGMEQKLLLSYSRIIVFVEKYLYGEITISKLNYIRELCSEKCKIICLTSETDKQTLVYMHEMGADNIIIKPISINSLIEKIATTISQDTSFKQLVYECEDLIQIEQLTQAEIILQTLFEKKPNSCIGLMLKGDIYRKRKQYTEAENCYLKASTQASMFLDPLKRMVTLYDETDNTIKKLEYLLKLDTLSPLNTLRKLEIGSTYVELNDIEKAESFFNDTLKSISEHTLELTSLTLMDISKRIKQKYPELAIKYIEKALHTKANNLTGNDVWMFNEIGLLLRKLGLWEKATHYYFQALMVDPNEHLIHYNLAMAFLAGDQYPEAATHLRLCLPYHPKPKNVCFLLGSIYEKLKNRTEAKKYYDQALEYDSEYQPALRARLRL